MKEEIQKALDVVRNGGVILYPTDTIWGLGCDPNNEVALEKLMSIKKRAADKSLIILVNNEGLLQRYVKDIPEVCYDLIDYSERPLTIVYPKGQYVSKKVLGANDSIAIRITKDPFCVQLIQRLKHGLVSTSANISNETYQNNIDKLPADIKNNVDYIVNLPLKNDKQPPSQIIRIGADSEVTIIRK
ncbi:MAG: threonylcarbamoyl-AMP synthase [Crocinitomix sp.]|nr:threonylcarbamoyl-AMP synthase [Crocinitomix sp.]